MIEIREVQASEYVAEAAELVALDQHELESHLDNAPAINEGVLHRLEESGAMHTLGVFDNGKVVGYCMFIVYPHLHYAWSMAQCSALYLHPEYRRGRIGLKLMTRAEARAKELGARIMSWTAKPNTALSKLLEARKVPVEDINYFKEL